MNKLYNKQADITSGFSKFLLTCCPNIRKTLLNFIPSIMFGMVVAESCVASDIAKVLKDQLKWAQHSSIVRRIYRLWNNKFFDGYSLYKNVISYILRNYKKKHSDNRVHITFDHMFSHDNYTVFMITMRIGTQGIPIYFECFKGGKKQEDAFQLDVMTKGIKAVHDLFDGLGFDLIFLADRWFSSTELLDYIDSLDHTYCIRLKGNINVYKDNIKYKAKKLKHKKYHATVHRDVYITDDRYKTNIVYSKSYGTNDPWIIITNNNVSSAIKDYSYRFGSVECMFKSQKSNGFNLEKISNMSIDAFKNMYSILCLCITYLTIIGADYSKNSKCYKSISIVTHKVYIKDDKRIKERVMSLFNTGLTLFKIAYNSHHYIRLPFTFKLYDV